MHGVGECVGNVQQLCAAKYSPRWWDFIQCSNSHGRYQVGVPDVTLECAKQVGLDWEGSGVGRCAGLDGKSREGIELLQESVALAKSLEIQCIISWFVPSQELTVFLGKAALY